MPTSKVYVVQENHRIDYTPAQDFGDVIFCTNVELKMMPGSHGDLQVITTLDKMLAGFDPENDFLVLTGNPAMIGYAFHVVYAKNGKVRLLTWDARFGRYVPRLFTHPGIDTTPSI